MDIVGHISFSLIAWLIFNRDTISTRRASILYRPKSIHHLQFAIVTASFFLIPRFSQQKPLSPPSNLQTQIRDIPLVLGTVVLDVLAQVEVILDEESKKVSKIVVSDNGTDYFYVSLEIA